MAEVDRAASGLMMLTLGGFGPPRVLAMGSLLQVNNDAWTCLVLNVQHASVGRMLYYNLPPISSVTLAESRRKGDNHLSYPIVNLDAPVPPKSKTKSKSVGPFAWSSSFHLLNHPSVPGNLQSQVPEIPQREELPRPGSVAQVLHLDGACSCPPPVGRVGCSTPGNFLGVTLSNSTLPWDRATATPVPTLPLPRNLLF